MSTDTGPIVRLAELEVDPAHLQRYRALLAEEIAASVAEEPGVLFLHAVSIRDEPHLIRILECYADHAAYEAHLRTPHFLKYKMETAGIVLSLRLLPTDPIALHGKGTIRRP